MKQSVRMFAIVIAAAASVAQTQQTPLLNTKQLGEATQRIVQLTESVAFVIPDLARASQPFVDQMKASRARLEGAPLNLPATYEFLDRSRKVLTIAESLPRPYPFPSEGQKQLSELSESVSRFEAHFKALLTRQEMALRPADRDQVGRYAEANRKLSAPPRGTLRVVFLGDSITDGWPLNEYFPDKDYVNRGIGGQVTSQMLARMRPDVLNLKPEAMVLLGGTNDIARGTSLETIQNNISMICDLADTAKIKVILASVLSVHDYNQNINPRFLMSKSRPPETIRNLNNWIRIFASNRGYRYLDYYSSTVDSAGFLRKDLADDGLHPNAAGYRIMAPLAEQAIASVVGGGSAGKKR